MEVEVWGQTRPSTPPQAQVVLTPELNIMDLHKAGDPQWDSAVRRLDGLQSIRSLPFPTTPPPDGSVWDWAEVGGVWHGGYAFME